MREERDLGIVLDDELKFHQRNQNSQLSSVIFAPILRTEPEDHDQTIHRVPVNDLIVILIKKLMIKIN